jgi:hypothetical protein
MNTADKQGRKEYSRRKLPKTYHYTTLREANATSLPEVRKAAMLLLFRAGKSKKESLCLTKYHAKKTYGGVEV